MLNTYIWSFALSEMQTYSLMKKNANFFSEKFLFWVTVLKTLQIMLDPELTTKISENPEPQTTKEVQFFLDYPAIIVNLLKITLY